MHSQLFLIGIIPFAYTCKTLFADFIIHSESPLRHLGTSVATQIETGISIKEEEREKSIFFCVAK